jgi:spermidine/putrescine transport system substrate-binding protein
MSTASSSASPAIKVNYTTFAHNEELYAKLKSGGTSYDIIIPSDYMIARHDQRDMIQTINFDNVPNAKYIDEKYRNPNRPENKYSVPYPGVWWESSTTGEGDQNVDSWDIIWDPDYSGEIPDVQQPEDAFGIALKRLDIPSIPKTRRN